MPGRTGSKVLKLFVTRKNLILQQAAAVKAYDAGMAPISPEQAHEYTRRWQQAGLREVQELREASPDLKLRQLAALVASGNIFPADPLRERDALAARERWRKLRLAFAGD